MRFIHESLPQRVVFATSGAQQALAEEVGRLDASRIMLIAGAHEAQAARELTERMPVVLRLDEVVEHVPVPVAGQARADAGERGVDLLVTVGGGSATGLAKAIALTSGLPIVAVPTTYAGSEATDTWGMTDAGTKTTGRDPTVLPRAIVYDAQLTLTLPRKLSVTSGLNALAHCVDGMWGPRVDPIDRTLAAEATTALASGLPSVAAEPADLAAREKVLYGAHLAGLVFASAGSGLHHKICHVLGGMFGLPHAPTHAIVLPHVLALNAPHSPEAEARLAGAFAAAGLPGDPMQGLDALRRRLDAPTALRDLGMPQAGIPQAVPAILAAAKGLHNPAPLDEAVVTRLLHAAWEGEHPHD